MKHTSPKHSPAPWKVIVNQHSGTHTIYAADNLAICGMFFTGHPGTLPQDSKLIAAAPMLLEALENALWHLDPQHNTGKATFRSDELLNKMQQAITAATE